MVRAIDLQTSVLQTSATEKIQQIQQQHADMQQRYFQLKLSEEDRLAQEKIREFEEAQKAKIRKQEEQRDKRNGAGRQNHNHAELPADDGDEESGEGGRINIKV